MKTLCLLFSKRAIRFSTTMKNSLLPAALGTAACCAASAVAAPVYEPIAAYEAVGYVPLNGKLLHHSDGNYYGTYSFGGAYDYGGIYRATPAGEVRLLASIPPSIAQAPQGTPGERRERIAVGDHTRESYTRAPWYDF